MCARALLVFHVSQSEQPFRYIDLSIGAWITAFELLCMSIRAFSLRPVLDFRLLIFQRCRLHAVRSRSLALLSDYIPVVLNVVRQLMRRDRTKASPLQVFTSLFLTPHGAQAFAALRQRHGH